MLAMPPSAARLGDEPHIAGSAGRESTEHANRAASDGVRTVPRMMRDVSVRSLWRRSRIGLDPDAPVLLAPSACRRSPTRRGSWPAHELQVDGAIGLPHRAAADRPRDRRAGPDHLRLGHPRRNRRDEGAGPRSRSGRTWRPHMWGLARCRETLISALRRASPQGRRARQPWQRVLTAAPTKPTL